MVQILMNTPFGFVVKLSLDGRYNTKHPYKLYINGELLQTNSQTILSIFGLEPQTTYNIEIKHPISSFKFEITTEQAEYICNVKQYGAIGDGVSNDTSAFAAAIYTAPEFATIYVPKGEYIVDHVLLKSNVDIYLEEGATLHHNTDRSSLAILKGYQKNYNHTDATINSSWEGHPLDCYCSVIYGKQVNKVRIYGKGTIDGSGQQGGWWQQPKQKIRAWRPRNITLVNCKDITFAGITSRNSAAWNIHPLYSENIGFYALNIESDPHSPNTDGLNPESCTNVEIVGCRFYVGDDCIALKAGKFYMSRHHLQPCSNVKIQHCLMERGHGGVVIGSELSCGISNITVSRCEFKDTDRGLRIKTRRGRGDTAIVQNITFEDVYMKGVCHCFVVNMYYCCDPDGHSDYVRSRKPFPVSWETPAVKEITFKNVKANNISGSAVFIYGLPESKVKDIYIEDSSFEFVSVENRNNSCPAMMDDFDEIENLGVFIENAENISFQNSTFKGSHVSVINGEEQNL